MFKIRGNCSIEPVLEASLVVGPDGALQVMINNEEVCALSKYGSKYAIARRGHGISPSLREHFHAVNLNGWGCRVLTVSECSDRGIY